MVSGCVSGLVTSALVVAQVPKGAPPAIATTVKTQAQANEPGLAGKKARVLAEGARAQTAAAAKQARAAQLENMIQQFMRQGRPSVRAELIFVRNICHLNVDQLRVINREAEAALKEAVTKFAEAQQQGRLQARQKGNRVQSIDGGRIVREHLAAVVKKHLTAEQFARYQSEVEKRDANRKQAGLRYLVDALDRDLYLTEAQRQQLTESLAAHWDDNWCMCMEQVLYGNSFYPMGIDAYLTPILDESQKSAWQGMQKVGTFWGFGGVWGSISNDNDALEEELGGVKRAEPADNLQMLRIQMVEDLARQRQLKLDRRAQEVKKSVAKDAGTKK
jgi:hypothetical protein